MTDLIGWKEDASANITTTTLDILNEIGLPNEAGDFEAVADWERKVEKYTPYGQWYETLVAGNMPLDVLPINFTPINAKFLHWMFGKCTDHTTYLQAEPLTSDMNPIRKPRISVYIEDNSGKYEAKGCIATDMTMKWKLSQAVNVSMNFAGLTHNISAATPTITYPESDKKAFNYLKTCTLYNGSTQAILNVESIEIQAKQSVIKHIGTVGYYIQVDENGPIVLGMTLVITGSAAAIRTDLKAGTERLIIITFAKMDDPDYYFTIQASVLIGTAEPLDKYGIPNKTQLILYCTANVCPFWDALAYEDATGWYGV